MGIYLSEIRSSTIPLNLECPHTQHIPIFNEKACIYYSKEKVQEAYPRYEGICSMCKQQVILYASAEHFLAGG